MQSIDLILKLNFYDLAELKKVYSALMAIFLSTDATHPASSTISAILEGFKNRIDELEK